MRKLVILLYSINTLEPCPFGLGLRKFALDPVVVIFFQKMSKKLQVLDQVHFKKIYNDWISQHLYFFAFLKKITTTGSSHYLSPNGQGLYFYIFCNLKKIKSNSLVTV